MINPEQRSAIIQAAMEVRSKAYAPYSNYAVGAALLARSGKIFSGVNVENSSYPLTLCAERAAVVKAVSEGEREFIAIAVATEDGGSPCGACRQVLAEFGLDLIVLMINAQGDVIHEVILRELLPYAFYLRHENL